MSARFALFCLALCTALPARAAELVATIERVKPSIVGIATYLPTRNPAVRFRGSGFVVADGLHAITNAHVVEGEIDFRNKETMVLLVGRGQRVQLRETEQVGTDADHDLALLRFKGEPLPALAIGDSSAVKEGEELAFTGFPIGTVLGLYPVTHRASVSAITPIAIPQAGSKRLDPRLVTRLRKAFDVFQLDATAYPGNSGSPLYRRDTAAVVGVLNMVFVKDTKENVLTHPSGISYAIPAAYVLELLRQAGASK